MKPDYGIDAPGVRRAMFITGIVGGIVAILAIVASRYADGTMSTLLTVFAALGAVAALYGVGMASYMTYGSRVGKLRTRERLLDLAHAVAPWTGCEDVLDVGCGRGLMMVGAARRLTSGRAVGVDLWRTEDQAGNTPDAALENARREEVLDRVRVETGDARALPFTDASFDVVLSHWVVHNISDAAGRSRALDEMRRVLRPGGVLVLADIAHQADYQKQLVKRGLVDIRVHSDGWASRIIGALSGGSFRPQALVGRRG